MIDSAIVYLCTMLIMMFFAYIGGKSKNYPYLWVVLASLCFGVVMGVRMKVGIDFPQYYSIYEQAKTGWLGWGYYRWEPGFQILYWLCASQFMHYSIPFGIIAFLQIFLVFWGTRSQKNIWVYLPLTLFLCGPFIAYNNIMRNMLAFSVYVCAIPYLAQRKYWKYLILILVAACFHKSALVLIIFPFIYSWNQQVFTKIWKQLVLFGISIVIMNMEFIQRIFDSMSLVMVALGYDAYMDSEYAEFNKKMKLGYALIAVVMCQLIVMLNSRKMKAFYESRMVNIMYDMYFFGTCIRFAFMRMHLIQRLNWYFVGFEFIVAALTLNYFARKKEWLWFGAWLMMYIAVFFSRLLGKDDGSVLYHAFFE